MVHMSYVPRTPGSSKSTRAYQRDVPAHKCRRELVGVHEIQRRGFAVGPRTWKMPRQSRRQRDERGAEMVEFAFVVVLLIALLYGIISYGLILSAQSTVTSAAADGARAGIVDSLTPQSTAEGQAAKDLSWMGKGACYQPHHVPQIGTATDTLRCVATQAPCTSNPSNQCLTVTVTYAYGQNPLFPELPGMGVITPSTISSVAVLQMSLPSS